MRIHFRYPQGVYINYRLTGLHGFGGSLDTWDATEPFLSADHRFYAIDLPGFGPGVGAERRSTIQHRLGSAEPIRMDLPRS